MILFLNILLMMTECIIFKWCFFVNFLVAAGCFDVCCDFRLLILSFLFMEIFMLWWCFVVFSISSNFYCLNFFLDKKIISFLVFYFSTKIIFDDEKLPKIVILHIFFFVENFFFYVEIILGDFYSPKMCFSKRLSLPWLKNCWKWAIVAQ